MARKPKTTNKLGQREYLLILSILTIAEVGNFVVDLGVTLDYIFHKGLFG
jgi:hypothetical protein